MHLAAVSRWLGQATQPRHPYYHPLQITLFASLSYAGTACFTSIPPVRGMTLIMLAYAISQLVTPFFIQFFEPYEDVSLAPFIGQLLLLTISLVLAKTICHIAGQTLSCKEVRQVCTVFFLCLYVSRCALFIFRQQLQRI
jgi:hypothetical protein